MLDLENGESPYEDKRNAIAPWKEIAGEYCPSSDEILAAGQEIMKLGIKAKDALHVACTIKSECDYFITTDDRLINKTVENIAVINPIDFVRETEDLT
jgi:predicted nucleic acid-binding protein